MIQTLGTGELEALLGEGGIDVVDVREPREWAAGHVPGARLVPLEQLRADPERALPHDRVAFVCQRGTRSMTAAKIAEQRGLKEIYSLSGGTAAWIKAGLPIEKHDEPVPPKRAEPVASPALPARAPSRPAAAATPAAEEVMLEPALDAIVGANLRELRTRRSLTLDGLAQKAGVSRTLLGQIELGKTAPSINVVWRIAQALEVPFSTLLTAATRTGTTVLRRARAKRLTSADGRFTSRALFPLDELRQVEFYELWLAPHAREEADAHQPGTRENLVVTAGRLDLKVGGDRYQLVTGDAIRFDADVPHAYENPGSEECWMHLVMSYTTPIG